MCCPERQGNEKIKETVTQIAVLEEKIVRYTKRKKKLRLSPKKEEEGVSS